MLMSLAEKSGATKLRREECLLVGRGSRVFTVISTDERMDLLDLSAVSVDR